VNPRTWRSRGALRSRAPRAATPLNVPPASPSWRVSVTCSAHTAADDASRDVPPSVFSARSPQREPRRPRSRPARWPFELLYCQTIASSAQLRGWHNVPPRPREAWINPSLSCCPLRFHSLHPHCRAAIQRLRPRVRSHLERLRRPTPATTGAAGSVGAWRSTGHSGSRLPSRVHTNVTPSDAR
jgi:hypothetical protein